MEIKISDNIRRLRKEKNMTQETLASILSITSQSVSKWERGDGYPDITMLPALANSLGVSVDVLLGNDKIITEERIQNYIAEYKKNTDLSVAKKAYEEFSYDYRIMMLYVNALKTHKIENADDEIKRICKIVLQNCEDKELCRDASYFICGFRNAEDRRAFLKKYIDYGQDWDWLKVYPLDSEEGKIIMQHEIADKWWHLNTYIDTYGDLSNIDYKRSVTHEEKIELIKKCEKIFYKMILVNIHGMSVNIMKCLQENMRLSEKRKKRFFILKKPLTDGLPTIVCLKNILIKIYF